MLEPQDHKRFLDKLPKTGQHEQAQADVAGHPIRRESCGPRSVIEVDCLLAGVVSAPYDGAR